MSNKKIKILFYGDSPVLCATGFSKVTSSLVKRLHATGNYEFKFLSINLNPNDVAQNAAEVNKYGPNEPCLPNPQRDGHGRQKLINRIMSEDFDILFTLQDTFILEDSFAEGMPMGFGEIVRRVRKAGKQFKWVAYFPIDGTPFPEWLSHLKECDVPVAYNEYGRAEVIKLLPELENKIRIVHHGVDCTEFYPVPVAEREEFRRALGVQDKFLVVRVDRNQRRKDMPRTMAIFAKFHAKYPDSLLYMHCAPEDIGCNLIQAARRFNLEVGRDIAFPPDFSPQYGWPVEALNRIYNAADVVMSTTMGEGCGLSLLEAMACRRPVLFPNNTAISGSISMGRGIRMACTDWYMQPLDMEFVRPLTDVNDGARKLEKLYKDKKLRERVAQNGYSWATGLTWDAAAQAFDDIFLNQYAKLQSDKQTAEVGVGFKPPMRPRVLFIGKFYDPPRNEHETGMHAVLAYLAKDTDVFAICNSAPDGALFEQLYVEEKDGVVVIHEPFMLSNIGKYIEGIQPNLIISQTEGIDPAVAAGEKYGIPVALYIVDIGHFCPLPEVVTEGRCKETPCENCVTYATNNFKEVRQRLFDIMQSAETVFAHAVLKGSLSSRFGYNGAVQYVDNTQELAEGFRVSLAVAQENTGKVIIKGAVI